MKAGIALALMALSTALMIGDTPAQGQPSQGKKGLSVAGSKVPQQSQAGLQKAALGSQNGQGGGQKTGPSLQSGGGMQPGGPQGGGGQKGGGMQGGAGQKSGGGKKGGN